MKDNDKNCNGIPQLLRFTEKEKCCLENTRRRLTAEAHNMGMNGPTIPEIAHILLTYSQCLAIDDEGKIFIEAEPWQ